MLKRLGPALFAVCALAQDGTAPAAPAAYTVEAGTRILLSLINSISTKNAAAGDRVYLQTGFPVLVDGRIVVPPGSYVAGTVTEVRRAGKVKGRAELYVRFDSLTLPNGVTRDFRSRVGGMDSQSGAALERGEGKIKGEGAKARDAQAIGTAAGWGTVMGGMIGGSGKGAGLGAAAGAAGGLIGVLATRGPDVVLHSGSTMEMVLDRTLHYSPEELDAPGGAPAQLAPRGAGPGSARPVNQYPTPGHPRPSIRRPPAL